MVVEVTPAAAAPVIDWLCRMLNDTGLPDEATAPTATTLSVIAVLLVAYGLYALLVRVISPVVTRIVQHTSMKWDDILFNPMMLRAWSELVTAIFLRLTLPGSLELYATGATVAVLATNIAIVATAVHLVNRFLMATYDLVASTTSLRIGSLKGIRQMLQIVAFAIGFIIIVSLLINRSPVIILSGLGASAAVLMLVFKDSILGLVAGVQLTLNDMLRPGDWITAPKHGANGTVTEVTLTTVKVRNFDQTIVTIPPYSLVSESFQNWRGMKDSGGRRVMRSISIDISTVRFLKGDELERILGEEWVDSRLAARLRSEGRCPNVTLLRHYLEHYIGSLSSTIHDDAGLVYMVRELQPTPQGLPIEIYFFTTHQEWVAYEHLQADVLDHILASVGRFGVKVYQSPSGEDMRSLRAI